MRKLIVLLALSLTTSAAWAQTEKAPVVTKLPGEENLSTRERAERDFLMPVRRKKAAETPKPTASAEQLASAAPETDATAHYNVAAPEPRTEEATVATHETRARRTYRHASALRSTRASRSTKASRAKAARAAKHTKASSRSKKAAAHKNASKKASTKKAKAHTATKKVKTKAKTKATTTKHKRRR